MIRLLTILSCCVLLCLPSMSAEGPASKKGEATKAGAMITRVFKAPRDFVNAAAQGMPSDVPAEDPFADPPPPKRKPGEPMPLIKTARAVLEESGIVFPDGASASFDSFSGTLTVVNNQAELDLCEAFFESMCVHYPHQMSFVLTVVEGPGEIIREANAAVAQGDAAKVLAGLLQQAGKAETQVRVVQNAFLETKSGVTAVTKSVQEHIVPVVSHDEKRHLSVDREMQMVGMQLSIYPAIAPDWQHIEASCSLELNPALPGGRQVSFSDPATGNAVEMPFTITPVQRFSSSLRMESGSTNLLGIARPYGKAGAENADVLWAAFLTGHIVKVAGGVPLERPQVRAAPLKVPAGMRKLALAVPPGLLENECLNAGMRLQPYLDTHGVAPAAGTEAVVEEDVLTVVNTPENVERIVALVDHLTAKLPRTAVLTLHTVQGSGAFLRGLAAQSAAATDHVVQWAQVQEALRTGSHGMKSVSTSRMESLSEVRASLEAVHEHTLLSEYGRDEDGHMGPGFETQNVGETFEFDPTIYFDDSVDLMLSHEFHPLPPQAGRGTVVDPETQQRHSFPLEHLHMQQTTTSLHVENGGTRLLSLLRLPGDPAGDQLTATFLHCDVVPHSARRKERGPALAQMLTSVPKSDSDELFTRSYRVSPDWASEPSGKETSSDDPFAANKTSSGTLIPRRTAREILEEAGISFPEGASVFQGGPVSQIVVRNTQENLDKVEKYVEWLEREVQPVRVALTSQVLEAPGPLVRELMAGAGCRSNHKPELEKLLAAVKEGKAKHLGFARIETTAGSNNARLEQGVQHPFLDHELEEDMRLVGFINEVETQGRSASRPVKLTLSSEFHTAEPRLHREEVVDFQGRRLEFPLTDFDVMKLTTITRIPDGSARMLAVWKPASKDEAENADVLQVLFITCDHLRSQK